MHAFLLRCRSLPESTWLIAILALALLIRLAAIAVYPHQPESDELAYLSMAANFVDGKGLIDVAGNRAMYNMGYSFFVLAPLFALFGEHQQLILLANALLGCLSVWLCHVVAREAGAGQSGRLLAALFWAVYLPACTRYMSSRSIWSSRCCWA